MSNEYYTAYLLSDKKQSLELGQNLYKLFLDQEFVDVTLLCADTKIRAHYLVLSATSNYFKKQFAAKIEVISVSNIKGDVMSSILQYLYTGRTIIEEKYIREVMDAAKTFEIDAIINVTLENDEGIALIENNKDLNTLLSEIDVKFDEANPETNERGLVSNIYAKDHNSRYTRSIRNKKKSKLSEDDVAAQMLVTQMKSEVKPVIQNNLLLEDDNAHSEYFVSEDVDGCYLLQELGNHLPGSVPRRQYDSDESTQEASDCEYLESS